MEKISHSMWPEIVFGSSDSSKSHAINRALRAHELRKIAPRLYTSNMIDEAASIVRRNCYQILAELYPGAILSHRSAFEGKISKEGLIVLTYKYTKKVTLPGLTIRFVEGKGPQTGDTPLMNTLFMASRARAYLENLQPSRNKGDITKTLSQKVIEDQLDKLCRIQGSEELNRLRDQARQLAPKLSMQREFSKLEKLIGGILGSQPIDSLTSNIAIARAASIPFDPHRIELLTNLAAQLKNKILPMRQYLTSSKDQLKYLAFFESYFSNYIEGTEFEIEEAYDIAFHSKIMLARPADAHDILATFQIVANPAEMSRTPQSATNMIELLKSRHAILMAAREEKSPGQFKTQMNRVGNIVFVAPELVNGTLLKIYPLYESLDPGLARAIFIMFAVAEIHPFLDGNGRIARIMMNAELVASNQCRIIIPTVYREDYILALRQLSKDGDPDAYIRMLTRAQEFTASIDFSHYETALAQLKRCNAFLQPYEGKLNF